MSKPIPKGVEITDSITKHMDRRFLSSVDLAGQGTVHLTVDRVEQHELLRYENGQTDENAILLHFKEIDRPLKLNATLIKSIIVLTKSNSPSDWKGKQIPFKAQEGVYFGERGLAVRVDLTGKKQSGLAGKLAKAAGANDGGEA